MALAPQVSALPPFSLVHDLRFLLVFEKNVSVFLLLFIGVLLLRSVFFSMVFWYVNDSGKKIRWGKLLTRSFLFTLVWDILLLPFAVLLFFMAVVPLAWFFFPAIVAVLILGLFLAQTVFPGMIFSHGTIRSVGVVLLLFLILTLAGGGMAHVSLFEAYVIAGLAGICNAWSFRKLFQVSKNAKKLRLFPCVPVFAVYGLMIGGIFWIFSGGMSPIGLSDMNIPVSRQVPPVISASETPVIYVSGFGSSWNGKSVDFLGSGYRVVPFSYFGVTASGEPLPYTPEATYQSLFRAANLLNTQINLLAKKTGRKIDILSDSEGTYVTQAYLLAYGKNAPVKTVILGSALLHSAQVYYPPGEVSGWGAVGGFLAEGFFRLFNVVGNFDFGANISFLRSIIDNAPVTRDFLACASGSVNERILLPIPETIALPSGFSPLGFPAGEEAKKGNPPPQEIPITLVRSFHGSIVFSKSGKSLAREILDGKVPQESAGNRIFGFLGQAIGNAWQSPDLPIGFPEPWIREMRAVMVERQSHILSCTQISALDKALVVQAK
ncbi:MAG TPA: hypothetical protein VFM02_04575 [Candidatus Paceibacterota bacterium]|nr:hypothetical protein [Candidatus Paceibacterota bacterium]